MRWPLFIERDINEISCFFGGVSFLFGGSVSLEVQHRYKKLGLSRLNNVNLAKWKKSAWKQHLSHDILQYYFVETITISNWIHYDLKLSFYWYSLFFNLTVTNERYQSSLNIGIKEFAMDLKLKDTFSIGLKTLIQLSFDGRRVLRRNQFLS